jgi:Protein of unknown function (DUF3108)
MRGRVPRRAVWWGVCGAVLLAHVVVTSGLADDLLGEGFGDHPARIRPMEVSYVSELAPALETPPPVVMPLMPPMQPVQRLKPVVPVAPAASAPDQVIDEPTPPSPPELITSETPDTASAAEEIAQAASAPPDEASAAAPPSSADIASAPASAVAAWAPASAAAASEPAPAPTSAAAQTAAAPAGFEWPPSTRLSYRLSGQYRGEIQGSAQVEWIRQDDRYQVLLEITVGPSFAPLMRRRLASEGQLGQAGLSPRRYEETTKIAFSDPRILAVRFEGDRIVLAGERTRLSMPGVQDTASQFVQLTWLFRTQPQRLQAGTVIEVPLALPRRVDRWLYDVIALEALDTPVGRIEAWHLKPRPLARPSGELTTEMWFAPSLQHLPVRFVVRQDAETYIDLLLQRLPQQAAK